MKPFPAGASLFSRLRTVEKYWVRFYKNLHLFLGPTIATDCLGLHLGIGF